MLKLILKLMKKSNKLLVFLSLILVVFIIIYFAKEINKTPPKPLIKNLEKSQNIEKIKERKLDWALLLPEIKEIISQSLKIPSSTLEVTIHQEIDLNNDKVNEVIVEILNPYHGAVALEQYAIFKIGENNKPEFIKLKEKSGEIQEAMFSQGEGGAGRYGFNFGFLPEKQIIYRQAFSAYNSPSDFCKVDAYIYKPLSGYFEYDENISKDLTKKYCKELCDYISKMEGMEEYFSNICSQF